MTSNQRRNKALNAKLRGNATNTEADDFVFSITSTPKMNGGNQKKKKKPVNRVRRGRIGMYRFPGADSVQAVESRTVVSFGASDSLKTFRLAKGLATSVSGTFVGFADWDGHINAMSNAFRWFRFVSIKIDAVLAAGPNTGANTTFGYQMGATLPGSVAALLDNEHAVMTPAAEGRGTLTVPRAGLLRSNEWYASSQQDIRTTKFGAVDVVDCVPSIDEACQGSIVVYTSPGSFTTGDLLWVTVTSVVEFKEPL